MQENIVLATPFQSTKNNVFDITTFLNCKPYLISKDNRIVTFVTQKILEPLDQKQMNMRILDVGSGDATVIAHVCYLLSSYVNHESHLKFRITVDCVEPCSYGIKLIRQMTKKVKDSGISMIPRHSTIENFLINRTGNYNAIVCCHTLYHIKLPKWKSVIQHLMSALQQDGILILNLVSYKSDIYRIKDTIEKIPGFQKFPKMYKNYGYDYYAEDLEDVLTQLGNNWEEITILADISFPREDVYEAIKELHGGSGNSSILQFFAFMFRIRHDDLLAIGKNILLELLIKASEGITFKSIDKMFIFRMKKSR